MPHSGLQTGAQGGQAVPKGTAPSAPTGSSGAARPASFSPQLPPAGWGQLVPAGAAAALALPVLGTCPTTTSIFGAFSQDSG